MEIDRRRAIVSLIERLCEDQSSDEARLLHPLLLSERWIFGPEFDCLDYVSTPRLQEAAEDAFKDRGGRANGHQAASETFFCFADATCAVLAMEPTGIGMSPAPSARDLVLIELKLGREEVALADARAVEAFTRRIADHLASDDLAAYTTLVIGHAIATPATGEAMLTSGANVIQRRVCCTYAQLVESARRRLQAHATVEEVGSYPNVPTTAISF